MSSKMDKVFAFDMDGVIADTLGALYRCYLDLLAAYGVEGTEAEFNQLNGPKISEIVSYLKQTYQLTVSEEVLLAEYLQRIEGVYDDVQPIDHVLPVINQLHQEGITLALASSSPRKAIERVLERFELTDAFSLVVSGDEVPQAKPAADIYQAVQQHFPQRKIYVIEDAPLGVAAAQAAGLEVIHFDPNGNHQKETLYHCRSMEEVLWAAEEILGSAQLLTTCQEVALNFRKDAFALSSEANEVVEQAWQEAQTENSELFNGQVTGYLSHCQQQQKLIIDCLSLDYKIVLAQLRGVDLDVTAKPLGVSGMVVDQLGRTLLGRRARVTEYRGWLELVPSGSLDSHSIEDQVRQEFCEETGLGPEVIRTIDPFCLVFDERHQVYDVGCRLTVDLATSTAEMTGSGEYEELQWVELQQLDAYLAANSILPTSRAIWQAYQQQTW